MVWNGWIDGDADYKEVLESIGISLGERKGMTWEDCVVPDESMDQLDTLWGDLVWCLEQKE
jgi:hypothetical protein